MVADTRSYFERQMRRSILLYCPYAPHPPFDGYCPDCCDPLMHDLNDLINSTVEKINADRLAQQDESD